MKVGIVGVGAVGSSIAAALVHRGTARHIVLVDTDHARARGTARDLGHAAALHTPTRLQPGDPDDLAGAHVVIVTAGTNERAGGATDRTDPAGRLRLLDRNADVYRDAIPRIATAAPTATVVVVTDPPDPLADLARHLLGHDRVLSTGTLIDTLRFRAHLATALDVAAADVHAQVIGEHGTTQVPLWSTAAIGGVPLPAAAHRAGHDPDDLRTRVDAAVRHANIDIIDDIGASRFGIAAAVADLTRTIGRDEHRITCVASHQPDYGTTLSLPSVVGARGVLRTLHPPLDAAEQAALDRSAAALRDATAPLLT
ncbi:lactate/malate family dehydrogenase [Nocardiopsis trehalosi]|uniref:lactate/malate family dehydrogenase n=1 Tax=Nocardiopsis trehalosi TaxID=109329 RepID=UPI00083390B2|nr:NAD(P)-binding domain-containing protein [Nocardiopsis trehalosi]